MKPYLDTDGARRATARRLLRAEHLLLGVGVVCLGAYGVACAAGQWGQLESRRAFERALTERLHDASPDQREWTRERARRFEASRGVSVEPLALLEIPAVEVSVMVLEGTDEWTLNRGVGRIEGTARPGEDGNLGIAGHRDGFFRGLRHLSLGDSLRVTTLEGVASYEVVDLRVVSPETVEVLDPTPSASLTLVTCHPFYYVGDAPDRFVVRALRVGFEPWDGPATPEALPAVARR